MPTLTVETIDRDGLNPTYAAADAGGDEFDNTFNTAGSTFLHVKNDNAGAINVTIETQSEVDGQAVADRVVNIPAGEHQFIGPFPTATYNDVDNKVQITYDVVASVTVAVLKIAPVAT